MKGELSHCPRSDMRHHSSARTVRSLRVSGLMPPQVASARKTLALVVAVVAQTGGQGGISRAPTLRPQGAVTVANLPAARAETNRAAHQARRALARRALARQDHRAHRDHRVRLMVARPRLRLCLRGAGLLTRSACVRLSY